MTWAALEGRTLRGCQSKGVDCRGERPGGRAVRCGDLFAESLWPTGPMSSVGPFHCWRLRTALA
jgi:hypothetical protein